MPRLYVYGVCALSLGVGYYTAYHYIYIPRYRMERLTQRSLEIRKMEGQELVQQFARLEMYLNNPLLMSVDTTSIVQGKGKSNKTSNIVSGNKRETTYGITNYNDTTATNTEVSPILEIVSSLSAGQSKTVATNKIAPTMSNDHESNVSQSENVSSDNYYRQTRIRRGNKNNSQS